MKLSRLFAKFVATLMVCAFLTEPAKVTELMDPPAGPELKDIEQKVSEALNKDPGSTEGHTKRAEAYYTLEKFRAKYTDQIAVSSYLAKRRRLLRKKDGENCVKALADEHPKVSSDIRRLDELRQRLALTRPRKGKLTAIIALLRNLAMMIWVIFSIPMCFTAVVLRIAHPPLRSFGVKNGKLPLDLVREKSRR